MVLKEEGDRIRIRMSNSKKLSVNPRSQSKTPAPACVVLYWLHWLIHQYWMIIKEKNENRNLKNRKSKKSKWKMAKSYKSKYEFLVLRLCPRFSDTVILTHKNIEISRAVFFCILQICKGSVTHGHTLTSPSGRFVSHQKIGMGAI